ncbi:putative tyrosine phosphatase [Leptomonas pyrrhocoris]|uniref:Putative tyrosine phosphatase n=1 Tax=Leptomonas pyrrhocoris TaxID=157538 RepID=A0A0N0DWZ5_LEPPY|nr:putative tyrosine phosphatase [Leptomonas pyrrhocoris]KPA82371.1 putative tyrosine phosphatase [Leptomonas pyrrhocoris]|eukprot:XP_015660810.1 putative tyrosine phosphatase [Leptomonas pyrrhocoris]
MNLSAVSAEHTGEKTTSPLPAGDVPAVRVNGAASLHATEALTGRADAPVGDRAAPPGLTASLPGIQVALAGAFPTRSDDAAVAARPSTPPSCLSNSVCSGDLSNPLLVTNRPCSTRRPHVHADGAPLAKMADTHVCDNHHSTTPYGESFSRVAEPSLSYFSPQPHHCSELLKTTVVPAPLVSVLHMAAVPLSPHVPQRSTASDDDGSRGSCPGNEEEKGSGVAAATDFGNRPSDFTFRTNEAQEASEGVDVAESPPPKPSDLRLADPAGNLSSIHGGEHAAVSPAQGVPPECCATGQEGDLPSKTLRSLSRDAPLREPVVSSLSQHHRTRVSTANTADTTGVSLPTPTSPTVKHLEAALTGCTQSRAGPVDDNHYHHTGNRSALAAPSTSLVSAPDASSSLSSPSIAGTRRSLLKPPARLTSWIRSRVSQNKVRFRNGDFNLDLTYITPHIIAMGYPAHGTEYYIRNPIDEVERFFDERHGGHFRLYNLCAERAYDHPHRFHGCFRRFPFDDHNAPPLTLILHFVLDATAFLDADTANVVAVHCKAGKGRTGLMVSCLLFYRYPERFATAEDAIHFFDQQRTSDGEGMTIPSQRRYVSYFERIVREFNGTMPPVQRRLALKDVVIRVAREGTLQHPDDLYFLISDHQQVLLDSRMWFPRGPTRSSVGCIFSFAALKRQFAPAPLVGDVKFAFFRRRPMVLPGKESMACYLWFNTTFCPSVQMVYRVADLDKVDVAAVGKAVMVSLSFTEVAAGDETAAATTPTPQPETDGV